MTDFDRVKGYYKVFDEKNRLVNSPSGRLEYLVSIRLLERCLPGKGTILDLGGGAGAYSFPLAAEGYRVFLADLSEELIQQAEEQNAETEHPVLCNVVTFIPYLSGSIGVVDRSFFHPEQVNLDNLKEVFRSGRFNNLLEAGFQEGYYPTSEEIEELFRKNGFTKDLIRSIRSFGYRRENMIFQAEEDNPELFEAILDLIEQTAEDKAILETCGHAVYVGRKA